MTIRPKNITTNHNKTIWLKSRNNSTDAYLYVGSNQYKGALPLIRCYVKQPKGWQHFEWFEHSEYNLSEHLKWFPLNEHNDIIAAIDKCDFDSIRLLNEDQPPEFEMKTLCFAPFYESAQPKVRLTIHWSRAIPANVMSTYLTHIYKPFYNA